MDILGLPIDGNWIDECSFVMSAVWTIGRHVRQRRVVRPASAMRMGRSRRRARSMRPAARRAFIGRATAADLASGMSVFPLCILALSVFSDWLLNALLLANRAILSVAGVSALFGVLEDARSNRRW
jgi:hypothetical protein